MNYCRSFWSFNFKLCKQQHVTVAPSLYKETVLKWNNNLTYFEVGFVFASDLVYHSQQWWQKSFGSRPKHPHVVLLSLKSLVLITLIQLIKVSEKLNKPTKPTSPDSFLFVWSLEVKLGIIKFVVKSRTKKLFLFWPSEAGDNHTSMTGPPTCCTAP